MSQQSLEIQNVDIIDLAEMIVPSLQNVRH